MNFEELGIHSPLKEMLASRNIHEPSEIQKLVIPKLLEPGELKEDPSSVNETQNLLFTSPTGTGKTLAYLLPLLQRELGCVFENSPEGNRANGKKDKLRILILAPTLELSSQIKTELDAVLRAFIDSSVSEAPSLGTPRAALLIGSVPLSRQIESLKKNRPLAAVGNPARILQLVKMKKLSLKNLCCLILDEGDRLMAEELLSETSELCRLACGPVQSGADGESQIREFRAIACSATFSPRNREKLFSLFKDQKCAAGPWLCTEDTSNEVLQKNIAHWAFFSEDRKKIALLRSFIAAAKPRKALVFTSRGGQLGNIVSQLQFHHLAAGGISGDMDKKARKGALDSFRKGEISILAATDLACRGLDIQGISHIIALDVPDSEEAYLHRSGRTGRAGKQGIMVSIGDETEMRRLAGIEKKLRITVYPKELYGGRVLPAGAGEESIPQEGPAVQSPAEPQGTFKGKVSGPKKKGGAHR
jgi:superfamily II DNA/RNA helicase